MLCWPRRGQALRNGGRWHLRCTLKASVRLYSTETAPSVSTANIRYHASGRESTSSIKPLELSINARHNLRALLRECSYLPDPAAKQYLSQHILSVFKRYDRSEWKGRVFPDVQARLQDKAREGRQALNRLRRANDGELKPLLRVLCLTYGRIGKRRHEFLGPMMPRDAVAEPAEHESEYMARDNGQDDAHAADIFADDERHLADVFQVLKTPRTGGADIALDAPDTPKALLHDRNGRMPQPTTVAGTQVYLQKLTPALHALAKSQMRISPATMTRPNPRHLKPDIAELNTAMRPMPKSRVKNMTNKWFANTLRRLLPPLPTQEWLRLQELADGKGIEEQLAQRRQRPKSPPADQPSALERVLMRGTFDVPNPTTRDVHRVTPRYMRRLYAAVFGQCPRMDWDAKNERWDVTWGSQVLARPHCSQDGQRQRALPGGLRHDVQIKIDEAPL
ncbi:hypothetical protein CLAFUW4_02424 [Fulvia fulva]|uniref:LYR motif-containing protein Cup1-like N-terminal domain-containing protein n=1 Tax=Passalora fulva TaxID=5499 RepID=A0A9Q8P519_PASFU|nr:uncharacterized protein CLAFUR5_02414 [Fulvia fulva]KAK4630876.1 hypothetical protein CLAFUR4_02419 [Fulvia fulva]KAK4634002.1 hypothetical protein CLAFUR0_02423 [Fulvia fulva]UJO13543.1 hypothetical protein CLAFUR5_02414 [Fulvia fulva]WPV11607.1 hypothetical protein CLAFUW4_02424 [Fulvia fulva]WPV26478.1 hypothetical protein CLAFUW7_02424 [Fulvia fulva]